MNNNHKVLRIIRLEEQEVQTKKLSPSFISLGLKIFFSFLAAVMFSFLFVMSFMTIVLETDPTTSMSAVIHRSLISSLIFILMLTLIIVLFAFYKMDGIHEGWTLDRATRTEKSIIWLWIFLVTLALCLLSLSFAKIFKSPLGIMGNIITFSTPLIFILFLVFFMLLASISQTYRSKIEELILKENKDESTEKNTKRIKIIRLKEREIQKEGLSLSFISLCVKILFFSLVVMILSFLSYAFEFRPEHFDDYTAWLVILFETLTFTLVFTLMMLSIVFYKVNGVDEGWTVDRATGMEKVVIVLWIFCLGVAMYFFSTYLREFISEFAKFSDFLIFIYAPLSIPSILTLFVILFASIIKTAKAYRSRIEELIIPEDKNE